MNAISRMVAGSRKWTFIMPEVRKRRYSEHILEKPFLSQPLYLLFTYFANYILLLWEALMGREYGNFIIIPLHQTNPLNPIATLSLGTILLVRTNFD